MEESDTRCHVQCYLQSVFHRNTPFLYVNLPYFPLLCRPNFYYLDVSDGRFIPHANGVGIDNFCVERFCAHRFGVWRGDDVAAAITFGR
jgi:hypothetical protein